MTPLRDRLEAIVSREQVRQVEQFAQAAALATARARSTST